VRKTNGLTISVSEKDIKQARDELAEREGVLVEYASATTLAACIKMASKLVGKRVALILTGNGLKEAG
jgi:threonine synthase